MIYNAPEEHNTEEEILGSVTHNVDTLNGEKAFPVQLRTSARVSKKLRLDLQIASTSTSTPIDKQQEKKSSCDKVEIKNKDSKSNNPSKRINGFWSSEDKNVFFKALNEYGKDFVAIQTHMNNKRKKRGISQSITKNKDQARHFYYRTWNKISKYVKFPSHVNKVTQELYGLINFGEFRKRMGYFSEKYGMKLNELIYSGSTQMRVRGKTIRIKTPVCRALRKLNQLEECPEDIKLPTRVMIELRPRDNFTWSRIQALSMNPRVSTALPLHSRLVSLIDYLQNKWQSPDAKLKSKPSTTGIASNISSGSTSDNKNEPRVPNESSFLRLAPKEGLNIAVPSVAIGEFVTSSRISLISFEQKFGSGSNDINDMLKQLNVSTARIGRPHKSVKKPLVDGEKSKFSSDTDFPAITESDGPFSEPNFVSVTVQQLLTLNSEKEMATKYGTEESEFNISPVKDEYEINPICEMPTIERKEEIIAKAKAGWTSKNANTLRMGDLYLMFGNDSKLQFEYWFEDSTFNNESLNTNLSGMLRRLISMGKNISDKDKVLCSCGHICKSNSKMNVHSRNKAVSKNLKINFEVPRNIQKNDSDGTILSQKIGNSTLLHDSVCQSEINTHLNPEAGSGTESFREQLSKLQPRYLGRRRRLGDRQKSVVPRMLPLFSKMLPLPSTQNSIKPSQVDINNSSIDLNPGENINCTVTSLSNSGQLGPPIISISNDNVTTTTSCTSECIVIPNSSDNNVTSSSNSTNNEVSTSIVYPSNSSFMVDQDEDSRLSSCSSLTNFLEKTLSNIIKRSTSNDGLTTPVILSSDNLNTSLPSSTLKDKIPNGRISPHWLYSEGSNLSYSSLLAELDNTAAQLQASSESVENSTSYLANDVGNNQLHNLLNEAGITLDSSTTLSEERTLNNEKDAYKI